MSNLRNYFAQAQDDANDNFFNYDGDDDFDFVEDEMDEFDSFDGDDDDAFDMATGGGGNSAPTSQPYNYQNVASISITMGISGISYQEFLYQSMNKPFVVGLTYYQSSTANQVLETLTLIQKDVNGNESQKTLVPTIDPYQQQSTIIAIKFSYKIDGFTSVVMSSLLGGATAKLYFYPAETSSIARTLTGRRAVSGYGNPNIVKSDKISLSASATRALSGGRRRR